MITVSDRYWEKVKIKPGGCWLWIGAKVNGYGYFRLDGKAKRAHRVSYEFLIGPIPDRLGLDHLCRNKSCVNPTHLEPVTQAENLLRSPLIVTETCPMGHDYNHENLAIATVNTVKNKRQYKYCKQCNRDRARRNYAAIRSAAREFRGRA